MKENLTIKYETVQQTARRLNVTPRTIQKWAKEGKIDGAVLVGRSYIIPADTDFSSVIEKKLTEKKLAQASAKPYLPLVGGSYPLGKSVDYINSITLPNRRKLAQAEQYYYSGQSRKTSELLENLLECEDLGTALSADVMYAFANIALERTHRANAALELINKHVNTILKSATNTHLRAYAVFVATSQAVLLHKDLPSDIPPMQDEMKHLPEGIRQFAAYILAYQAFLDKDYSRSLGIADTALSYSNKFYPLPYIHLLLVKCIVLMCMKRTAEAKECFLKAYHSARPDYYIEPFSEVHMLLGGLPEICLKRDHPEDFKRLIEITVSYGASWRRIHNTATNRTVTNNLTPTEFTIAMLYTKSWTAKEIATHMEMSQRMIKYYIASIYDKLGVSSREELRIHMLP